MTHIPIPRAEYRRHYVTVQRRVAKKDSVVARGVTVHNSRVPGELETEERRLSSKVEERGTQDSETHSWSRGQGFLQESSR